MEKLPEEFARVEGRSQDVADGATGVDRDTADRGEQREGGAAEDGEGCEDGAHAPIYRRW